jgi:Ca-activated chloride channel family protein
MKKSSLIILFLCFSTFLFSQEENKEALEREARADVREGNKLYNQLKFGDAEVAYKKALSKNPNYEKAAYNLGNSMYQQNRNKEAVAQYELSAKTATDKMSKAENFHNMGNSHMKDKQYEKAVAAYKNSMRNNSKDDETRYNLAMAQELLKDQQNKDNEDNKDNKDDKKDKKEDKNKDQKDKEGGDKDKKDDKKDDKDKGKDKKDDKGDEKKDDEKQNPKDKENQQPRPNQLSPEQMKQLLEAMNNEENKTQQKLNEQKSKGIKIKQEKDW